MYQFPEPSDPELNSVTITVSPTDLRISPFFTYFSVNQTLIMMPTLQSPIGSFTFNIRLDDSLSVGSSYQMIVEVLP
jgi:hypothetical protein